MKPHLAIISLATLSLIMFSGCVNDNAANKEIPTVVTEEATKGILPKTVTFTSTVKPKMETVISSKVTGTILELQKELGDIIDEGTSLAVIDSDNASTQLNGIEQNISALLNQKVSVGNLFDQRILNAEVDLKNTLNLNKNLVLVLKTEIENAKYLNLPSAKNIQDSSLAILETQLDVLEDIEIDNAEKLSKEQIRLLKLQLDASEGDQDIFDQQVDLSKAEIDANLDSLESQIEVLEKQIRGTFVQGEASINELRAKINVLERDLERVYAEIKLNIDRQEQGIALLHVEKSATLAELDTAIIQIIAQESQVNFAIDQAETVSPYGGVVTEKFVELGEFVTAGTPLFKIAVDDEYKVELEIPDFLLSEISKLKIGTVQIDASEKKVFTAEITKISPTANPLSGKVKVELTIKKSNDSIISGLFVRVSFALPDKEGILVSNSALISKYGQTYLFVENSGVVEKRIITVAERNGGFALINEGVKEGEKIIIKGNNWLRDGEEVIAKPKLLSRHKLN